MDMKQMNAAIRSGEIDPAKERLKLITVWFKGHAVSVFHFAAEALHLVHGQQLERQSQIVAIMELHLADCQAEIKRRDAEKADA